MIVRGTRPDPRAPHWRWHLPDLVVDMRESAWHPEPTGVWTMVWCSPHESGTWPSPGCGFLWRSSGNIDCARANTDTCYRFHETSVIFTAAGGQSSSAQRRTKDILSPITVRPRVLELLIATSRTRRRLKGTNQLLKGIAVVGFNGGIEVMHVPAKHAAWITSSPKFRIAHLIEPTIHRRLLNDY